MQLEQLRQDVVQVELDKGQLLFHKGDMPQGAYIVVLGMVKLSISSLEGGDKALELRRPGQSFGVAMIFQRSTEVKRDLKKSLVASLLNPAPATLSRILHHLIERNLIEVRGSLIRIESNVALKSYQVGATALS